MSVPRWLAEQVGPTRSVVATDIDTTWLAGPAVDRVQMLRHDIGTQDPPATDLDLVHARLVLTLWGSRSRPDLVTSNDWPCPAAKQDRGTCRYACST
jgi:hypothetical protein